MSSWIHSERHARKQIGSALDLNGQAKGHRLKIGIATRLRREATMTLVWIATRLQIGTSTHLAHHMNETILTNQAQILCSDPVLTPFRESFKVQGLRFAVFPIRPEKVSVPSVFSC